ncbi:MAG: family 10 glycosylhydrolase [Candidatus Sumerlaea chitinivorans]|nr:family 10 glycosylhydrolase [Candidatus Sumerlaea chitinivorans]
MDIEHQQSTSNFEPCPLAPSWIVSLDLEPAVSLTQWRERLASLADAQVRGVLVEFFRHGFPVFRSQAAAAVWGRRAKRYHSPSFENLCEAALELDLQVVAFSHLLDAGPGLAPLSRDILRRRRSNWILEQTATQAQSPDEAAPRFWWNSYAAEVRQYLVAIIAELVTQYPVDAIFLQRSVLPESLLPAIDDSPQTVRSRSEKRDDDIELKTSGDMKLPTAQVDPLAFYRALRTAAHRGALPVPLLLDSRDWYTLSNRMPKSATYFDGIVVGLRDLSGEFGAFQVPDTAQLCLDLRTAGEKWETVFTMATNEPYGAMMVIVNWEQIENGEAFSRQLLVAEVGEVLNDPQVAFAVVCSCFEYLARAISFGETEASQLLSVLLNIQKPFAMRVDAQEKLVNLLRFTIDKATNKRLQDSVIGLARRLLRVISSYPIVPLVAHAIPTQT